MSARSAGPRCMHIDSYARFDMYVSDASTRKQRSPFRHSFPEPNLFRKRHQNNRRSDQIYKQEEYGRDINSAPNKTQQTEPLPQLNNIVTQNNDHISNNQQYSNNYAGITTKERDNRQGRFATTWADTRVIQNITRNGDSSKSIVKPSQKQQAFTPSTSNQNDKFKSRKTQSPIRKPDNEEKDTFKLTGTNDNVQNDPQDEKEKRNTETEDHKLLRLALELERAQKPMSPRERWKENYQSNRVLFEEVPIYDHQPFKPDINTSEEVFVVYTGITRKDLRKNRQSERPETEASGRADNSRISSDISSPLVVSPRQKKEYILSKRETYNYLNIHAAYNNDNTHKRRRNQVLNKMTKAQLELIKEHNELVKKREKQREESKRRQQKQLAYVRKKFEREQCRRFRTQYVTHRIVEHEVMNRDDYGLPEKLGEDGDIKVNSSAKHKRKQLKPIDKISEKELRKRNEKKYEKMFNRPSILEKVPAMEGIDTVVIIEKNKDGKMVEKKKMVSDVIKEAQDYLDDNSTESAPGKEISKVTKGKGKKKPIVTSTVEDDDDDLNKSLDSIDLDDDDSDIFERARKKYGLDVDSSIDTKSRF
ncbi:hypothetical protein LOTGIDRAFT_155941 [Lottia gigantea]|uniref:Uncharacterized protein n=1 Tax=Lottia gigantea TaxID=225164 RepID=V4B3G8_LOTGI|nr:hypothetical protein LOTGIDRAFT_155941 [Lottia gigantea]ESO82899.1 hypothetical protein LOTGIDRAFT_155941 [Lottia gigantea]